VIVGWKIVSRDHNERERRKELRASIIAFQDRVRICEEKGLEYWLSAADSERATALSVSLKSTLQSIAAELARIQVACPGINANSEMVRFRRALTGAPFEAANRTPCQPGAERLADISDAACDLTDTVDSGYLLHIDEGPLRRWKRRFLDS